MEMKIDDFFKEYGVQHRDEETGNVETVVLFLPKEVMFVPGLDYIPCDVLDVIMECENLDRFSYATKRECFGDADKVEYSRMFVYDIPERRYDVIQHKDGKHFVLTMSQTVIWKKLGKINR